MELYRALSNKDENTYNKYGNIYCTWFGYYGKDYLKHFRDEKGLEFDYIKNHLDEVMSHVLGCNLSKNMSPWISTSKDLEFVMREYAVPQSGKYNTSKTRKPISVIEEDSTCIYDSSKDLADLLYKLYKNETGFIGKKFIIDLSDTRLNEYYTTPWIDKEEYPHSNIHVVDRNIDNEKLPEETTIDRSLSFFNEEYGDKERKLTGLKTYSAGPKEVLIAGAIPNEDIKYIISPLLQDMMFGTRTYDVNRIFDGIDTIDKAISNAHRNLLTLDEKYVFDKLYVSSLTAKYQHCDYKSLIDLIKEEILSTKDVNIQYRDLKALKRSILSKILGMPITRLVDDHVLVGVYDGYGTEVSDINDLVLYQKGDRLLSVPAKGKELKKELTRHVKC